MLDELTAEQYEGWIAWMRRMQPFPNRDDVHWGMLIASIHNQWAETPKRPVDFMPYHDEYEFEAEVTAEDIVLGVCSALGI